MKAGIYAQKLVRSLFLLRAEVIWRKRNIFSSFNIVRTLWLYPYYSGSHICLLQCKLLVVTILSYFYSTDDI